MRSTVRQELGITYATGECPLFDVITIISSLHMFFFLSSLAAQKIISHDTLSVIMLIT